MTNLKSAKRAFLASLMAVLVCFTMFVGTTFAWFTDSVTSGSNVIQAGNLDIEAEYTLDGKTWNDLDGANDLFQKGLWEPGHTEVVALRIKNEGTLALKYNAGMNIVSETVGKNKEGKDIVLSEILTVSTLVQQAVEADGSANMVGDIALQLAFMGGSALGYENTTSFKAGQVLRGNQELEAGAAQYIIIKVDMPESVANEANPQGDAIPSIEFGVNIFATQYTSEIILVTNPAEAQAAFNNAESGAIIQLMPGVNFGTLEFAANVTTEKDGSKYVPVAGSENTEKVDYFTDKYPTGEFSRKIENVTIIGAKGATVDAIKFVTGTFKATIPETGKQTGSMYRFVEVKNLVIDGVTFTDKSTLGAGAGFVSPIFMDLQAVKVDGITVKNCTLNGNVDNMNFVYAYGNAAGNCTFGVTLNDVVIKNNTVAGIARLCELRECENVTIKGNTASNLVRELALLANNAGKAYSGTIVVSENKADGIAKDYLDEGKEGLFLRVGVGGTANVVVENNVITNSGCVESSFVSVTDHTGTLTVANNTLS